MTNTNILASIIVPCKNAGPKFADVLDAILAQKFEGEFEVILIDSGSSDYTLDTINKYADNHKNIKIIQIKPSEFGHGKTRNLGASIANGEFLVFITQDAMPFNNTWLSALIKPFTIDSDIVGVFGRHIAYPDCNIFESRNLELHFNGFGTGIVTYQLLDKERYKIDQGYKHLLCFYSDNNSAMRKNIWLKYPYQDVDFAEDQIWAKQIIENGYKKAYSSESCVYHSHEYSTVECLKRSFDDHRALLKIYDYKPIDSIFKLAKISAYLAVNDFKFLLHQKDINFFKKSKLMFFTVTQNFMKQLGAYLAFRSGGSDVPSLSRDKKLRR